MEIIRPQKPTPKSGIETMAKALLGEMVKVVVDVEKEIMAVQMELHADGETLILENGSLQKNLWGINLYPGKKEDEWIEFDSMINLRPRDNNRSRGVEDPAIQQKIKQIVKKLIL